MSRRSMTPRRGHTLVELVVSVAVSGILVAGLTSTLYIASRAANGSGPTRDVLTASAAAADVLGELPYAITFSERSANAVEFTVADRDQDTFPETIRYAWSGTPGNPLTRQYNGGAVVDVVENVYDFDLGYRTKSVTTTEESEDSTTSPEILLAFFEGWDGQAGAYTGHAIAQDDSWRAEYFTVSGVPPEATVLTITRVELLVAETIYGIGDSFSVAIHEPVAPGDPEPAVDPIGTPTVISSSSLPSSYEWIEYTFSDVVINSPADEYVIVMKGTSSGSSYDVMWLSWGWGDAPDDSTIGLWTGDSGNKWEPKANSRNELDHEFRIYGTYETPGGGPVEVTRYFLNSIDVKLRVGSDAATRIDGGVQVPNAPEVPAP